MYFSKPPLGTPLNFEHPMNKDLKLHLAMNEGNGDHLQDLSMHGNHGTLNNFAHPPTVASGWNPGRTGVGVNFDGTDDYVDCGNNESLKLGDGSKGTLSFWVKSNIPWADQTDYTSLVQKGNNSGWDTGSYHITSRPTYILFRISDDNSSTGSRIAVSHPSANEFHLFSMTWDGSNIYAYINGIEEGTTPQTKNATHGGNEPLWIGKASTKYFNGSIDEVRILNRAMTAKEVLDYHINPWQVYLDED